MLHSHLLSEADTVATKQVVRLKAKWLNLPLALSTIGLVLAGTAARAQTAPPPPSTAHLTDVIVKGHSPAQVAKAKLNKIPGGFSVVDSAEVSKGRVQTNADLLKLQPGVIAAATGAAGFDSIKVSIRGSGVNNGVGYFRNGIKYEFDDLPVTTPSGTPYELFDPQGLDYTEILRGDNAFDTGDLALGGTIDYHTNTGRTAPYTEVRTEIGSYGYLKGSAATGGVIGPWDYYVNVIGESQHGWQQHSAASAEHFIANIGYQVNADIETRVYLRYGKEVFYGPGADTLYPTTVSIATSAGTIFQNVGGIEGDKPNYGNPSTLLANYKRTQPGSELIGDVTKIRLDDTQNIELGLAYQNFPIVIGPGTGTSLDPILAKWDYGDIAAQAKYENTADLLGHGNDFTAAAYWSDDIYGDAKEEAWTTAGQIAYPGSFNAGLPTTYLGDAAVTKGTTLYKNKFNGSIDQTALLTDNFEAINNVWLTLGGAIVNTPRNFNTSAITWNGTTWGTSSASFKSSETNIIPRFGVRWDVNPDLQLFASYGGNIEPREDWAGGINDWSLGAKTLAGQPIPDQVLNLKNQEADTAELGFRGHYGIFAGSADVYYADVADELLSVYDPTLATSTTINAPHSTHEGIEAELDTVLWQSGSSGDYFGNAEGVNRLHFVQVFDYSNFYFNKNSFAGTYNLSKQKEPGLPPEYYQGELAFDGADGTFVNIDANVSSGEYVSYINSARTAPYVTYGLTVGWKQERADKKGWQVSGSIVNLTNAKYTAVVSPTFTYAATAANATASVYPGQALGLYATVDYKF
jgi:iron complex outermembrane receptor protein